MDAFFIVAGYPTGSVVELSSSVGAELVPISSPEADALIEKYGLFSKDVIPADTYEGIGEVESISVGAQWVVSADVDADLVYQIAKAVWNEKSRKLLDKAMPRARPSPSKPPSTASVFHCTLERSVFTKRLDC